MTNNIKFTDQIKAMDKIEQIYLEKIKTAKILNYSTIKKEMIQEIKAYYTSNNIEIDDKTICEGIDLWFKENYLTKKKLLKISFITAFLTYLFIKRKSVIGLFVFIFILISLILYII